MTPTEATEAMGIIELLTKEIGSVVTIYDQHRGALVEYNATAYRYRHVRGGTLLEALRKAKAAKEGKK